MTSPPAHSFDRAPVVPVHVSPVRRATPDDVPALSRMLARAFERDPFIDWLVRQDARREQRIQWHFEVSLRQLSGNLAETYTTHDRSGATIWKRETKLSMGEQVRLLPAYARVSGWSRLPALLEMLHYMEPLHQRLMPEPHLYLFVIGVEPAQQRRGLGSLLLEPVLEQCDRERSRAYLETTREENLAFYMRHGFELVQVVERVGWPKFWLMIRLPRRLDIS